MLASMELILDRERYWKDPLSISLQSLKVQLSPPIVKYYMESHGSLKHYAHLPCRKFAIETAKQCGIPLKLDYLNVSAIPTFDEAFITSSTREVMPVVKIDDQVIGEGTPGPITKR